MDANLENVLTEYYKLKSTYENNNFKNRRKIINTQSLSKKEKQLEFQILKPKCINCKRAGGTLFTNTIPDKSSSIRRLSAVCGVRENPCNLKIIIELSPYYLFNNILTEQEEDIKRLKNIIISYKNSILFGYETAEKIMPTFDTYKKQISDSMEIYSSYLDEYYSIIDNKETNEKITRNKIEIQLFISAIKTDVLEFNKTNDSQFILDAMNVYINKLIPLTKSVMTLKNKELLVQYDDTEKVHRLIQSKYRIQDIEFNTDKDKVVSNDTGVKVNIKNTT